MTDTARFLREFATGDRAGFWEKGRQAANEQPIDRITRLQTARAQTSAAQDEFTTTTNADFQPARYGERRRPSLPALLASLATVTGILAPLFLMHVASPRVEQSSLIVFDVLAPTPPPAESAPPAIALEEVTSMQAPVVTIAPMVAVDVPTPATPAPAAISPVASTAPAALPGPARPAPVVADGGDLSSRMIAADPPRYPHESRRKKEQGTVVLSVLLATDGSVADISIADSSGFARLDEAALKAVRRWRWSPTIRDGAAVMVKGLVEIPFILRQK